MAYGVDHPTEVGYVYRKTTRQDAPNNEFDGVPVLEKVFWETPNGMLEEESMDRTKSLADSIVRKKAKREPIDNQGRRLQKSGDGTVPYLSLSWAHTWLLHGIRAQRQLTQDDDDDDTRRNALDDVDVSHRPKGAIEWVKGPPPKDVVADDDDKKKNQEDGDTGTTHPHGTKYKPEMVRYHNTGQSRKTGMKYSTTVIEAIGVEHKETTRCV